MTNRPIFKLPNPRDAARRRQGRRNIPRPTGPGRACQGTRFQARFDALAAAISRERDGIIELRHDPAGIAPDRALVFETAGSIQDFARAASQVGLELISEDELEDLDEIPEGFSPPAGKAALPRTLYTTMPTVESSDRLLTLWRAYNRDKDAYEGAAPWWHLFDHMIDLRTWGPTDRFPSRAREIIAERLPQDDNQEVKLELEIWPSAKNEARQGWRDETIARVQALGGTIVDQCTIRERNFIYDALLVGLSSGDVRSFIDNPFAPESLAWLKSIHFILPQTIAQALPSDADHAIETETIFESFDEQAPTRAALFDGVPLAAHPALDAGLYVEDVHDIVPRTIVEQRHHATAMASLILRGDLQHDRAALRDSRLVSIPVMVDDQGGARSPSDRLFVDVIHSACARLFLGQEREAIAPHVFVINFSIAIPEMRFAGRMSALARLLDWWASEYGVLFVVSAGNVKNELVLRKKTAWEFANAQFEDRREAVQEALADRVYDRTLMAPAESINSLTVGAISHDLAITEPQPRDGIVRLSDQDEQYPAISNALGLGFHRSLKPDLLHVGGMHEIRVLSDSSSARIRVDGASQFAGLVVAAPTFASGRPTKRSIGTSCAAALTTRAILQAAHELVVESGPFKGQELPRRDLALLTRALAVNSARWPAPAEELYNKALDRFGSHRHRRAKEEVARYYGHGVLLADRMRQSPEQGVTLIGLGDIRKDGAKIFDLPLPPSMAEEKLPRSMDVTLAWFSPIDVSRASYRLAGLEAIVSDTDGKHDQDKDTSWGLALKGEGPDDAMVKRGTVWSRRLIHKCLTVPSYKHGATIPIRVQCRDVSNGGLSPDLDIRFAIVVTLVVEAEVQFDIYQEVHAQIVTRICGRA